MNYALVIHLIEGTARIRGGLVSLREKARQTYVLENFVPCLTTFSTASKKSRSVAIFRRALIANIPALKSRVNHMKRIQ